MKFQPSRLLRGPHVQTLSAAVPVLGKDLDATVWVPVPASVISRPSGETSLKLRMQKQGRRPLVLMVHGVGGAATSSYVRRAADVVYAAGYHCARLNLRGAGDSPTRIPDLYHMGLTADIECALAMLADYTDVSDLFLLGFSGGGSLSLRTLTEGVTLPGILRKVAALSPPLKLGEVRRNVERKRNLPYHLHVLRGLHRSARHFVLAQRARATFGLRDIAKSLTVREFDRRITVPMHGFESVDAYDDGCSGHASLHRITLPTLIVHAKDDPMVPIAPLLTCTASSSIEVRTTEHGGHLGWVPSAKGLARTWALDQVLNFFAA
jgi:uncharacterized protein